VCSKLSVNFQFEDIFIESFIILFTGLSRSNSASNSSWSRQQQESPSASLASKENVDVDSIAQEGSLFNTVNAGEAYEAANVTEIESSRKRKTKSTSRILASESCFSSAKELPEDVIGEYSTDDEGLRDVKELDTTQQKRIKDFFSAESQQKEIDICIPKQAAAEQISSPLINQKANCISNKKVTPVSGSKKSKPSQRLSKKQSISPHNNIRGGLISNFFASEGKKSKFNLNSVDEINTSLNDDKSSSSAAAAALSERKPMRTLSDALRNVV